MATPIKKPPVIANMNGGLNYNTATTAQKQGMQDNWTKLNTDSAYLGSEMARAQQVKSDLLKADPKANTADQDAYITKMSGISAGGAPKPEGAAAAPAKTGLDYASALSQANQQLDPMYQQAVKNVQAQQYQNQLNGGELASAQGGAHSGLAADLQNKVNIAAAGEVAGLDAQRSSQAAQMAQALLERDQDVNFRNRQQDYTEKSGDAQLGLSRDQFNRGILESDRGYNRGVLESDRGYNYQVGRDKVSDSQWGKTFDRGVLESDRDYNRNVFTDDRDYNRGVLESDRDYGRGVFESDRSYSASQAKAAAGGSKSSTSGISDVNQPWTVSDMKSYINKNLPGSKTGPMGPASPNQTATIENLILSNPNLSDKSVIQLYQYYGIPVPQ